MRQLQRIVLDYSSKYDPRFYQFILNGAVLHILHATLQSKETLNWRFNVALGMAWMKDIFVGFPVIGKVAQAYMAMGMTSGMISEKEARDFMEDMQSRASHKDLEEITALCIVDFEAALASKQEGRAEEIAQRFEELALFEKFVIT
ncbi:hypothetical protein FGRMN_11065 [Fusarium graminum]|nr:hypothetical protein FGRMN_11065 [Fusarium graminum]